MSHLQGKKIVVTGGHGFLGSAVVKKLMERGVSRADIFTPKSTELDLVRLEHCQKAVVGQNIVIHLAARVGGIDANEAHPGKFFYDNALMGLQLMESARLAGVQKFVSVGTVCEYPKLTPLPFKEDNLWGGPVDEVTGPYGLAKKMLLVQGEAYAKEYGFNAVHLLPINLYGPGDHFNLTTAHVLPMLIMKAVDAKEGKTPFLEVWGTGKASREFLYIDDAAEGVVLATEKYDKPDVVNLGIGRESTIKETVEMICKFVGYTGEVRWDSAKPDGQPRRMFDVSRAEREFGFKAKVQLEDGLKRTIDWYLNQRNG